jgi:hypothetical protein
MTGVVVSGRPSTPLWQANSARDAAAKLRAEWLVSLDAELVSVSDLLLHACTLEGRPLLRLPLRQVLLSQPDLGVARAGKILARIQDLLGLEMPVRKMTVAWLLDRRAGGRRFMAWLDATQKSRSEPWPGFPYRSPFSAPGDAQSSSRPARGTA